MEKIGYTPTNWVNGQTPPISAENLNKIETGIEDSVNAINGIVDEIGQLESQLNKINVGENK